MRITDLEQDIISFIFFLIKIKLTGRENYHEESLRAHTEFNVRNEIIRRNIKNLLKIASHDTWICDPKPSNNGEMK